MSVLVSSVAAGRSFVARLHREEEGMETVQIIMTLAIAALVMTGVGSIAGVGSGSSGNSLLSGLGKTLGNLFGGGGNGGGFSLGTITSLFGS